MSRGQSVRSQKFCPLMFFYELVDFMPNNAGKNEIIERSLWSELIEQIAD